jgi:hypothetical protein
MSSINTSKAHQTLDGRHVANTGRMSGGEHKHNIVAIADDMPKRGSTGAGDRYAAPCNGLSHKK